MARKIKPDFMRFPFLRFGRILLVLIIINFLIVNAGFAGDLDDFENDSAKDRSSSDSSSKSEESESSDNYSFGDMLFDFVFDSIVDGIISSIRYAIEEGVKISQERTYGQEYYTEYKFRTPGEPLLPVLRFDLHRQSANADISALDFRFEVGKGPLAVQIRHTHYSEIKPNDTMDFNQIHGLLRMSGGNNFCTNLGLGFSNLKGNNNTYGFSVTLPMFYHFHENIGFEFKPCWSFLHGNIIKDYDSSLLFTYKYYSLSAGYRYLVSPNNRISGPYIGTSIRW